MIPYDGYKIYGPYKRKDGRKHVIAYKYPEDRLTIIKAPVAQPAEAADLKFVQFWFESRVGHHHFKEKVMFTKEDINHMFTYHAPNEEQIESMKVIREHAALLAHTINNECPASADTSAAIRKLRECVMTANAAIILNP